MYFGVLVSTSAAVALTLTLNLIGGYAACGASVSVRRQVRVPPPVHVQPGASIDVTVSPDGIASVTVTIEPPIGSASLGVSSRLVTVTDSDPPRPRASGVCVAS